MNFNKNFIRHLEYKTEYDTTVHNFLKNQEHFSSRLICSLKKTENGILINGLHARTIDKFSTNDILSINLPYETSEAEPKNIPIDIVYEDEDVLIVNKPPFLVCHETRNHQGDTLANAVAYHLKKEGKTCTFRAINRLDRDTTGLVVIALNRLSAERLKNSIDKTYYALVRGCIGTDGTIDLPIERVNERKIQRQVGNNGQRAVTHYRVIKTGADSTLLEIKLETGRTHQIRVHFSALNHPLVGDTMYGTQDDRINHQCLHCGKISFVQPITGEQTSVSTKPTFLNLV